MPAPRSAALSDPVLARIRALAPVSGTARRDAGALDALLAEWQLEERLPPEAFIVAAELIFDLLAADRDPSALETAS